MHTRADCKEYVELLEAVPGLSDCTTSVLEDFVTNGTIKVRCPAGHLLSSQAHEDQNLYVMTSGSALLVAADDVVVALERGDYFGRNPVRSHHQFVTSVIAVSDVEVLVINSQEIARLRYASCRELHPSRMGSNVARPATVRRIARRTRRPRQPVLAG